MVIAKISIMAKMYVPRNFLIMYQSNFFNILQLVLDLMLQPSGHALYHHGLPLRKVARYYMLTSFTNEPKIERQVVD